MEHSIQSRATFSHHLFSVATSAAGTFLEMALTFKVVFVLLVSVLALCQASSDPDPVTVKILEGFDNVTTQSNNLRIAVQNLNIFNAAEEGFIIAEGFASIVAKIAEGTIRVDSVSTGPLSDDDAQLVVQALTTFVQVHQALLNVIIGKHGLLTLAPFFEPIRLALVSLEAAVDTLALDLIDLIPTQKAAANAQFASLSVTLTSAITTYSQPFLALADPDPVTVKILEGFDNVTTQSNNLRIAVQNLNIFNAAEEGFIIAEGFASIVAKIAEGTIRVDSVSTGPLSDDDAQLVVQALTTFVQVHQALLNVIIGKHGLLTLAPFFEPIRLALVSLEAAVDTLALDLIDLIPTQKAAANAQFASLSVTLTSAITTYSQPFLALADPDPVTVKILEGFDNVTTQSNNLRIAVQNLNIFNAAEEGFIIAEGFASIVAKIAEGTIRVDSVSTGPLSDDDAQLVVQALTTFVQVHQALLNVIIGKHGLLTLAPFFEPIRLALVSLEAAVDTLALDLIDLIPTQKAAANAQFASLSVTLTSAITTYSQPFLALADPDPVTVKILEGFDNVTTQSNNLRIAVQNLNIFNAAEEGFIIAEGFASIVAKIAEGTTRVDSVSTGPLSDDDAQLVVQALTTFVQVHQALLNVIIGKHGLLTLVPFFEPIRLALVSLEAAVDTLALDLIDLIPTQKAAANAQFASLSVTLTSAITTYSSTLQASRVAQY